ncbi:MAG: uncharacterized protein JWO57_4261 [Pseudonocardiales bacterium]|nr:uncharacterized protein [Pseudonocardiales bacterium]
MRWQGLFADLEAQAEALERAERAAEVDERARIEVGALGITDRVRPSVGAPVRLRCAGGLTLNGTLIQTGPDWLLVDEGAGREAVVALRAVVAIGGLGRWSDPDRGAVGSRLGLRHALRGLVRDRSPVLVYLVDGSTIAATLDRVGADFVEVAAHPLGETRRRGHVREMQLLTLGSLVAVRRQV